MEKRIGWFLQLGKSFEGPDWERAKMRASSENEWFTPGMIEAAAEAIRKQMLDAESLRRWVGGYPALPFQGGVRVGIVMAGNLPLVGFADLLAVLLSGHRAVVKPSSKDRALTAFVIDRLRSFGAPVEERGTLPEPAEIEALIATGSDESAALFRSRYGSIPSLLRGTRHSVALLTGRETPAQLRGLADDLFLYWGMGCRNVSRLFVPAGYELPRLSLPVDDPPPPPYKASYLHARALATLQGTLRQDGGFYLLRNAPFDGAESPRPAEILCTEYTRAEEPLRWIEAHARRLQCTVPNPIPFGQTQLPAPGDYADGVDTLAFLSALPLA